MAVPPYLPNFPNLPNYPNYFSHIPIIYFFVFLSLNLYLYLNSLCYIYTMTSFQIKLLAIATMVIDHIGLFFFPNIQLFRIIGRISYPLFAFLIANGAHYTKDMRRYLARMFIFALVSQIPFYLAGKTINPDFASLNVLFTFALALAAISIFKKSKNKVVWLISALVCLLAAELLKTDYGGFGVLLVISFYLFFKNIGALVLSQILISFAFSLAPAVNQSGIMLAKINLGPAISLLSLLLIALYNQKEGPKAKYLFYIFYPLQYVVFFLLKLIY